MNIENIVKLLRKARMETKNPIESEIYKFLTEFMLEYTLLVSEVEVLANRIKQLEDKE